MNEIPQKALKIITLALDPAAQDGEWQTAAIKFAKILRGMNFPPAFFDVKSVCRDGDDPPPSMSMPFGKFKGKPLTDLPDWYFGWVMDNIDLRDPLLSAMESEMERRKS